MPAVTGECPEYGQGHPFLAILRGTVRPGVTVRLLSFSRALIYTTAVYVLPDPYPRGTAGKISEVLGGRQCRGRAGEFTIDRMPPFSYGTRWDKKMTMQGFPFHTAIRLTLIGGLLCLNALL